MKKQTKQAKKEKMIKESEAQAKFDALKANTMRSSYHAAMSIQEILTKFREFIEDVKMTQPNEQTLLKKRAEEFLDYIDERQMYVEAIKAMTGEFVPEEEKDED